MKLTNTDCRDKTLLCPLASKGTLFPYQLFPTSNQALHLESDNYTDSLEQQAHRQ